MFGRKIGAPGAQPSNPRPPAIKPGEPLPPGFSAVTQGATGLSPAAGGTGTAVPQPAQPAVAPVAPAPAAQSAPAPVRSEPAPVVKPEPAAGQGGAAVMASVADEPAPHARPRRSIRFSANIPQSFDIPEPLHGAYDAWCARSGKYMASGCSEEILALVERASTEPACLDIPDAVFERMHRDTGTKGVRRFSGEWPAGADKPFAALTKRRRKTPAGMPLTKRLVMIRALLNLTKHYGA